MRKAMTTAAIVGVLVVLVGVALFGLWPHLLHQASYPGGRLTEAEADPARYGLAGAEQVWLETADGTRIHGWWITGGPKSPGSTGRHGSEGGADAGAASRQASSAATASCGAVIYFHGNGNTIAPRAWLGRRLSRLGVDVLLFDYRGYGRSEGRPSEAGLRLDARAAWEHVVEERGVAAERVVLFGHSLGSAVATDLALDHPEAAALVVGAPFPGFPPLFRHHAPWLPLRLLPWTDGRFEAGSRIAQLAMPLLVALGEGDRIIPPRYSRRVYDAAPEPKRLVVTPADHAMLIGHPDVWSALEELLRDRLGC